MGGINIGVGVGDTAATVTDSITVRQDIGTDYMKARLVTLDLMSDGTVRWRDLTMAASPTK